MKKTTTWLGLFGLYLLLLAQHAAAAEKAPSLRLVAGNRQEGAEDLLWVLINRLDFLFY